MFGVKPVNSTSTIHIIDGIENGNNNQMRKNARDKENARN